MCSCALIYISILFLIFHPRDLSLSNFIDFYSRKSHLSFSHIFNLANSLNSADRNFCDTQILASKILRINVLKKFHRLFFCLINLLRRRLSRKSRCTRSCRIILINAVPQLPGTNKKKEEEEGGERGKYTRGSIAKCALVDGI